MCNSSLWGPKLLLFCVHFYSGNQMTDNAGWVFSEMRGNAASYKDKKSVPAFYLIGLHLGRVILHNAQSGSLCRPESKCQREEEDRVERDLNPKASLEIYNGRVNHCPCSISPSNVCHPLEQRASSVWVCSHVWICFCSPEPQAHAAAWTRLQTSTD